MDRLKEASGNCLAVVLVRVAVADVLVVGGGGASLRAAIAAAERGASVLLVSKGRAGRSGATLLAGADLTLDGRSLRELGFPGAPDDSPEKWMNDIVTQGFYLNNQRLVEVYVRDAARRVGELLDRGLEVLGSAERAIDTTGESIAGVLLRWARESGVEVVDDVMVVDLLLSGERVAGAFGLDLKTGETMVFRSKSVVMATGGWHKAYDPNAGSRELSGDGVAAAYRAGAYLANMEFVTFCNNIVYWPPKWRGNLFLYILHSLAGGRLTNSRGEEFLRKYDPVVVKYGTSMEWNKCFISIASALEVREGRGSPHGGVYYDVGDVPWGEYEERVTKFYPNWRFKGVDFSELAKMLRDRVPIEVGPAAEYFDGGLVVDENMRTSVPGLFAAGECSTGVFGANRVAAATTEMIVEGAIAGERAAEYAKGASLPEVDDEQIKRLEERVRGPLRREEGVKPVELLRRIQRLAHEKLGPVRERRGLEELIEFLEVIRRRDLPRLYTTSKSERYNREWVEALELENIVLLLEISAKSALMRTESRGVHYRLDCPHTDNRNWLKEVVVRRVGEEAEFTARPVAVTLMPPPTGIVPYWEMMREMMLAHSDVGGSH